MSALSVTIECSHRGNYALIWRAHGSDSALVPADGFAAFLSDLARTPGQETLRDWFARFRTPTRQQMNARTA